MRRVFEVVCLMAAVAEAFVLYPTTTTPTPAAKTTTTGRRTGPLGAYGLRTGTILDQFKASQMAKHEDRILSFPYFQAGDTIAVDCEITEGSTTRVQQFAGVCIRRRGSDLSETFTVRKISSGIGVERTFPLIAPFIKGIKVVRRGSVRRARLYYLRGLTGKSARLREKVRGLNYVKKAEADRLQRIQDKAAEAAAAAAASEEEEEGEPAAEEAS